MKTRLTMLAFLFFSQIFAQIGGNQLYGGNNSYHQNNQENWNFSFPKVKMNDTSLNIEVNILNNVKADFYMVTLGVNEENVSVELCNSNINQRIKNFKQSLFKLGIKSSDVYVDFISQTKIYNYVSDEQDVSVNIQQVDLGFEIKKNLIFKLTKLELFDKIVELASKEKIYNIVNVDYYADNQDEIYENMLNEATKIFNKRLELLDIKKSDWEITPMVNVQFGSIQPGKQYKKFQAYESGSVSYSNYYQSNKVVVQKEERKSNTFYFDGQETNSYDKIINASSPIVGLQYIMNVTFVLKSKVKPEEEKVYYVITPNGELKQVNL